MPQAVVSHVGSAMLGARSDFALYHGAKNRLWLLIKNTPWPLVPVVTLLHLPVLALLLVMHALRGEARPVLRGFFVGLAGLGPMVTSRRSIQAARTASAWTLLRAMAVSPLTLARRYAVIRPRS